MPVSNLPADQIAVLELVLEDGHSYDEIAELLSLDAHTVRARAHAAIDALGPNGKGARLTTARRAELADFLLGQQDEEAAEATRNHLVNSSGSRAWARIVASELKPLGGDALPKIPTERKGASAEGSTKISRTPRRAAAKPKPATKPAAAKDDDEGEEEDDTDTGASPGRPSFGGGPSSRLGGALLIGGVLLIVIVAIVLLTRGGDDDKGSSAKVSRTTTGQTTNPAAQPKVVGQLNLKGQGKAVGIAQIVQQAKTLALVIAGQGLPADKNTAYAVWLYNSPTDAVRLGYAQPSQTAGRIEAIAPLPANASKYKELVISAESRADATQNQGPKTPTKIVLRGKLDVGSVPATGTGTGGATTTPGATITPGTTTAP